MLVHSDDEFLANMDDPVAIASIARISIYILGTSRRGKGRGLLVAKVAGMYREFARWWLIT